MNSALQLLLRIPYLSNYLKQINLKVDVNYSSPMGQNGKASKAFIELNNSISECQVQGRDYFNPKAFKGEIGKIWPIFKGSDQQDSQELLTIILNALNDELNIMKHEEKYLSPDYNMNANLSELSLEAWSEHIYSDWSFMSFAFAGMLCSNIECSECKNASYNFESFTSLSLSIPETKRIEYVVVYIFTGSDIKKLCFSEYKEAEHSIKRRLRIVSESGNMTYFEIKQKLIEKFIAPQLRNFIDIQLSEMYGSQIVNEQKQISLNSSIVATEVLNRKARSFICPHLKENKFDVTISIYIRFIYKTKYYLVNQYNYEIYHNGQIELPSVDL